MFWEADVDRGLGMPTGLLEGIAQERSKGKVGNWEEKDFRP